MSSDPYRKAIEFANVNLGRPFVWGQCDCNTFALDMMDAMYGTNLAAQIKGKYGSPLQAFLFRRRVPGSLINILKAAGFEEVKRGFERTGDLLIVADPKWEMVHVCLGAKCVSAFPDQGVQVFPMTELKDKEYTVWRMPSCRRP